MLWQHPIVLTLFNVNCNLTHLCRVTLTCVSKLTIFGSNNGLSPCRRQAIIWTNAGILLIGPSGTNLCEILIEILIFSSMKMHLKFSSGIWRPFCLGLNVLRMLPWLYRKLYHGDETIGRSNGRLTSTVHISVSSYEINIKCLPTCIRPYRPIVLWKHFCQLRYVASETPFMCYHL